MEGKPKLTKPKYNKGDVVKFKVKLMTHETIYIGEIFIIDAFGTFADNSGVSYDIMVGRNENKTLYKHVNEKFVLGLATEDEILRENKEVPKTPYAFYAGNTYKCKHDIIICKQLAFVKNHRYLCKVEDTLIGYNKKDVYTYNGLMYNLKVSDVELMDKYFECVSNEVVTEDSTKDNVNHPSHYIKHPSGVECIDIVRHYNFSIGNAIKYLWRAGLKSEEGMTNKEKEIEDLNKALWYIQDRIKELKEK